MNMMVYGVDLAGRQGQQRVIAKVRSRAAFRRALRHVGHHVSDGFLRDYGSPTGNEAEVAAAEQAGEGVVLTRGLDDLKAPFEPALTGER